MKHLTDGLNVATLKPERKAERTKYLNKMNCPYDQLEKTLVMLLQNKVDTFTIAIVPKSQQTASSCIAAKPTWFESSRPQSSDGTSRVCNKKILVDYYIITWMSEEKL